MNRSEGKKIIESKVKDFAQNENQYLNRSFGETETRDRFIDPFFTALGWNFDQTNISRHLWDVHREYAQRQNAKTKRPDYVFRHKGKNKFFVEAKAPWVPLTDKGPVFQAKSYAFSTNGKTPIVVLTDFEEFRVFNALQRPNHDNPLQGLLKEFDLEYTQYIESWDLLYDTFSKEAVFENSLDLLKGKVQKNTKTLDKEFLEDLTKWREMLAKKIAIDNLNISVDEVNECVQRILDRLIFLRNLEDREVETDAKLQLESLAQSKEEIYPILKVFFREMDKKYNGLIFKEHQSEKINVDDKTIKSIIKNLCPPISPYQFEVIEPEILGRIYERFLGSKIRLTDSHRAKVEEKPEVRHAGGVYYTPEWVVHYIVENTLGKLIKGKSPKEIRSMKVLDPACGSGSFLLGAFSYLLQYHEEWYRTHASSSKEYKNDFYYDDEEQVRVRLNKKASILKENIYGIDIDSEAVEVAIMSLYLKLLEQGYDKGQGELMARGFLLPDLIENIRQGNSLIDREMLLQTNMFGDEDFIPFDWKDEESGFGQIFKEAGGFDCIIGNPPYIRIQEMQKFATKQVDIYKEKYFSATKGNIDIYIIFIERCLGLLNNRGLLGFICPYKFFNANYGERIRGVISKGKHLAKVLHFGVNQVFENASTYTCLLFLCKKNNKEHFQFFEYKSKVDNMEIDKDSEVSYNSIDLNKISSDSWIFLNSEDNLFLTKMKKGTQTLEDITSNIFQGPISGADSIFILTFLQSNGKEALCFSKSLESKIKIELDIIKPYVKGKKINKYSIRRENQYILYPYDMDGHLVSSKMMQNRFPLAYKYFMNKTNKKILISRENGRFKHIWWSYSRPQNLKVITYKKIISPFNAFHNSFALDEVGDFIFSAGVAGGYGVILKNEMKISYEYLLGIFNSKVMEKFLQLISTALRGGYYSYENRFIKKLPIYIPDPKDKAKYTLCQKIEQYAKDILALKKNSKDTDAAFLEKKIDAMVAELYGI